MENISRSLPVGRRAANDRAPSIDEIRKLIDYPDRRMKPIVFTMVSSGIRIGAWDYLRWKDIVPLSNDEGEIVAAKLVVYSGDSEEYYCFVTPEAHRPDELSQLLWQKITEKSGVMRDIWQTTNTNYGAR